MKVLFSDGYLQLIPQEDDDQKALLKLTQRAELYGWGCDSSGKVLHATVPLLPIGTISHAKPTDGLPPSGGNDVHM